MKHHWFKHAKRAARQSQHDVPVGCCIVKKNKLISIGYNKKKTHTKSNSFINTIHAELAAILSAKKKTFNGCELYLYREKKDGTIGKSKPCIYCQSLLKSISLTTVHYSDEDGYKTEIL